MTISEKLKALRIESNLTLDEASMLTKIPVQTLKEYESSEVLSIPLEDIDELAIVYDVNPYYFTNWEHEIGAIVVTPAKLLTHKEQAKIIELMQLNKKTK